MNLAALAFRAASNWSPLESSMARQNALHADHLDSKLRMLDVSDRSILSGPDIAFFGTGSHRWGCSLYKFTGH